MIFALTENKIERHFLIHSKETSYEKTFKQIILSVICAVILIAFSIPQEAYAFADVPSCTSSFASKKTTVKATVVSQSKIKISWNKVAGAKGYKVYISKKKNGGYILVKTLPASKTSYVHTNRTAEKKYYYKVRAYRPSRCIPGKTTYTRCSDACSVTIKSYIRNEKPILNLTKPSTLYWNKIKGADGYIVYRSTDNGETFTKLLVTDRLETVRPDGETGIYYIKAYKKYGDKTVYSQNSNRQEITAEDIKPELPPVPVVPPNYGGGGSVITPPAQEETLMLIKGVEFNEIVPSAATSIIFTDIVAPEDKETRDLSIESNGSIVGWLDNDTYYVSTQKSGKNVIFNYDCMYMFIRNEDDAPLTSITFDKIDTSKVLDVSFMFCDCNELEELDLTSFNTEQVVNMNGMFSSCFKLESLDISSFNTKKVTDMSDMFYYCKSIKELDFTSATVSEFNTAAVENMSGMFYGCNALTNLNVSNFDTSQVTNMNSMFCNCYSLESLDLSSFNVENVEDMYNIFLFALPEDKITMTPEFAAKLELFKDTEEGEDE